MAATAAACARAPGLKFAAVKLEVVPLESISMVDTSATATGACAASCVWPPMAKSRPPKASVIGASRAVGKDCGSVVQPEMKPPESEDSIGATTTSAIGKLETPP